MKHVTATIAQLKARIDECGDDYRAAIMMAFVKRLPSGDYVFDADHPGWAEAASIRSASLARRAAPTKTKRAGGCGACGGGKSNVKPAKPDAAWHNAVNQAEEQQ